MHLPHCDLASGRTSINTYEYGKTGHCIEGIQGAIKKKDCIPKKSSRQCVKMSQMTLEGSLVGE